MFDSLNVNQSKKESVMLKKACIALMVLLMAASVASARVVDGVDMPETLQFGDDVLVLNGIGTRVVMYVIKPYVAGLYLKAAETDARKIMMADETMAIRLNIISGTGRGTMMSALRKGIRSALDDIGGDFEMIRSRFDAFQDFFPEDKFEEGNYVDFAWVPAEGLKIYKNGSFTGVIEGIDFKQAFFGIWLNDSSPADSDLKVAFTSGDVSREAIDAQGQWLARVKLENEKKAEEDEAKAAARSEAEARAKAEAEEKRLAEEKARAEEEAKKLAAAAPAKPAPAKAPARVAAPAAAAPMSAAANNALVSALLVNAIKTSEQIAAQQGKPFDINAETRRVLDLWSTINAEVSR
jgi:regulator of protease activity HflC (stomatin/prohibitin superfamily)